MFNLRHPSVYKDVVTYAGELADAMPFFAEMTVLDKQPGHRSFYKDYYWLWKYLKRVSSSIREWEGERLEDAYGTCAFLNIQAVGYRVVRRGQGRKSRMISDIFLKTIQKKIRPKNINRKKIVAFEFKEHANG